MDYNNLSPPSLAASRLSSVPCRRRCRRCRRSSSSSPSVLFPSKPLSWLSPVICDVGQHGPVLRVVEGELLTIHTRTCLSSASCKLFVLLVDLCGLFILGQAERVFCRLFRYRFEFGPLSLQIARCANRQPCAFPFDAWTPFPKGCLFRVLPP